MIKEIDGFIDAMTKVSRLADLRAERARLAHGMRPRCGNCDHWMKSSECPKEVNVKGRSQGPSCEGIACKSFVEKSYGMEYFREALADVEGKIAAINL